MSGLKPTHNRFDLGEWLLRCVMGLAAIGSVVCAMFGVSALIGAPSVLPIIALFPIVIGALIVDWTAVLLLGLEDVRGRNKLKWLLKYVPRSLLLLTVLAAIFSVMLFSQISSHQTNDGSFPPEFFAGFVTVFYVCGGAILVGLQKA